MRFTWLDGWKVISQKRQPKRGRTRAHRLTSMGKLLLDSLEDRTVPAFAAPVDYGVGSSPRDVVTGDFDGDTDLDLAVADYSDSTVSVLLGNGDGTFQEPALAATTGANPLSVAVGDFNEDGKLDIVTANSVGASVLIGNGDGTFGAPSAYFIPHNPTSVAVGDFTGDGIMDIGVTSTQYGYYGFANVLVGDGVGNFSGPNTTDIGYGNYTSATAFNADGLGADDLVTANTYYGYYYGSGAILLGDTSGYLQLSSFLYTGNDALSVSVGDINADGAIDLVTTDQYSYYTTYSLNSVTVLLGDGGGGFGGPQTYPTGSFPVSAVLGEFTGDGNVDLVTANYYGNDVSLLYGVGDGTFSRPVSFAAGSYPYALAAGAFNGDTLLDVATANVGDSTVSVLLDDGDWPGPPPPIVYINDVGVTEGNTGSKTMTFTVYLSEASGQNITVHYETANGSADGSDFTGETGDVTITGGLGLTSQTFTIDITGDRIAEPTETFVVNLSAPVNATIGDAQGTGYIYDDEPRIYINDTTVTEGNTGSVNATFTVSLSALSDEPVTVHYATAINTAGDSDFTSASGDVTIPAFQYSNTFTVAVTGDRFGEVNETYLVNLSAPVNAGIGDSQGVGTIVDNEPRISINNVSKKEGNGGTAKFVFTVSLSVAYDQTVTVNFATANGTGAGAALAGIDYQAKSGTVTFAPGVRTMTFTINVITEKLKESSETFFVNLSAPSSNAIISVSQGIGTILNDDNR